MATPCSSNESARGRPQATHRAVKDGPPPSPGRPFVLMNLAVTADGCIATANRQVTSFGSQRDRGHLFALRATVDAVLCGARTVRESPVNLDAGPQRFRRLRLKRGLTEQPLRVVVSGSGYLPQNLRILKPSTAPLVVLTTSQAPVHRLRKLESRGVRCAQFGRDEVDLAAALGWLHDERAVRRLLVEGGGHLNAALLQAHLVDELYLTLCPIIFGGRESPSLADGRVPVPLTEAARTTLCSFRSAQEELFLRFTLDRSRPDAPSATKGLTSD